MSRELRQEVADLRRRLTTLERSAKIAPVRQSKSMSASAKLPTGQYQYTYDGMITQNQQGFMPIYAAPMNVGP